MTFSLFRTCRKKLKECVPILTTYEALQSQFDWLTDGGIAQVVAENLPQELQNLELYIRWDNSSNCDTTRSLLLPNVTF
jgi:hypothetical protein